MIGPDDLDDGEGRRESCGNCGASEHPDDMVGDVCRSCDECLAEDWLQ